MSEEMNDQNMQDKQQKPVEEKPEVYSVKKDESGFKLNRRGFLATAAAAAATAAIGVSIHNQSAQAPAADPNEPGERMNLEIDVTGMTILPAVASFERVWKITNNSTSWCREAFLRLYAKDDPAKESLFKISDIAPGEKAEVLVHMDVPEKAGEYLYNWQMKLGTEETSPKEFPLVLSESVLAESAHPYLDSSDQLWTITNPDPEALHTKIHFTEIGFEPAAGDVWYDYLTVEAEDGTIINKYAGYYADIWSSPVPGRTVILRLHSDADVNGYGFLADQLQSNSYLVFLPIIRRDFTPTPIPTPTSYVVCKCNTVEVCTCNLVCVCDGYCSCDRVCTCQAVCSCDGYCTCDQVHYWYPN